MQVPPVRQEARQDEQLQYETRKPAREARAEVRAEYRIEIDDLEHRPNREQLQQRLRSLTGCRFGVHLFTWRLIGSQGRFKVGILAAASIYCPTPPRPTRPSDNHS